MLKQLFNYINLDYAVFPVYSTFKGRCTCGNPDCKSVGKHPKIGVGPSMATKNIQVINSMYDLWLNSNIGIATGKISNIVVLDIDPRDGGDEFLKAFTAQYGELPETVTAISGGNGLHYYFKYPDYNIPSRNHLRSGLDFKSDNDWIIAPPSIHASENVYKWKYGCSPNDIPPTPLPKWLINLVIS